MEDDHSDDGSDASTNLPEIFLNDPFDNSSDSESELDGDESDNDSDDDSDNDLLLDEEQHLPEYYPAEAESLNVSQLRQKCYSPKTQEKLDEIRGYQNCRETIIFFALHHGV